MTVYQPRGWRRTCDVHDAEDRRVGFIYRNNLWDASGVHLATVQGDSSGQFVQPGGTPVASFAEQRAGILLNFQDVVEGRPFVRMLLLAAVLSW
jgi:hypothetical protein